MSKQAVCQRSFDCDFRRKAIVAAAKLEPRASLRELCEATARKATFVMAVLRQENLHEGRRRVSTYDRSRVVRLRAYLYERAF
jgi:hypothetical protein